MPKKKTHSKRPKYNNKYMLESGFRSKLEEHVSAKMPKRKGVTVDYEADKIQYQIPKLYNPDFTVSLPNGKKIFIEVKGYFRSEDQVKMRAVKFCNPGMDIRMVFGSDSKVQGSKMRCSDWCRKYDFPFSIGHVPKDWLSSG